MSYYIPTSLKIDKLLTDHPAVDIVNFRMENLLYLLDLITSIPATNKKLELIDGYVPLNAKLLQNEIRNYKQYLDYLLETYVLVSDKQYIIGQKSKGYKFADQYSGKVMVSEFKGANKVVTRKKQISAKEKREHKHLLKWYDDGLQIDEATAKDYIEKDLQRKLAELFSGSNVSTLPEKNPYLQYNYSLMNIHRISEARCSVTVDDNVFRLHSCLTNTKSELRNLINYDGSTLVSIDIKNCQPFLSTLILNSAFWVDNSSNCYGLLHIQDLYKSFINKVFNNDIYHSFIKRCKEVESCINSDVNRYKELVESGEFYRYVAEHVLPACNTPKDKLKIKEAIFQVLFTDNRFYGQEEASCKRVFKEEFPTVYKLFALIKQKDKTSLPRLLQRIESHLVLKVITKRIAKENPLLPIFTIHDSIVTTEGNEAYVQRVMTEELKKAIGIAPAFSVDWWTVGNLKFTDGSSYTKLDAPENALAYAPTQTFANYEH